MRFSALLFLVCVIMTSFVDAHMYLRNPVSRGGLNNNGGTGGPCAGLAIGSGSVSTFSAGQTAIFQFRVNQHGPAPFEFRLSTGNDVFTTVLKANIENKVSAGPDGYNGVNVEIQIPNTPCSACAIQLSGMGQTGGTGKWWNCADIRIVTNFTGPVPDSIAPLAGPTSGGTEVTVTGTHFGTSAKNTIKCRFDMAEVEGKWESSTSITCKSPKRNQPTAAIVEVSLDDGKTYSTSGLTFDYTGDAILPEVLSVDPPFGLANTTLVVKGKNFFSSGVDCKFGNKTVHAVYVSETEVTCNIPDGILVGNSEEVSFETRVDGSDYSKSGKTVTILNETGMSGMVAGVVVGVAIFIVIIVGVVALLVIKRGSYGSETTPANWQKGRV